MANVLWTMNLVDIFTLIVCHMSKVVTGCVRNASSSSTRCRYVAIFVSVKSQVRAMASASTASMDEYKLAKRLALIVVTDFLCWVGCDTFQWPSVSSVCRLYCFCFDKSIRLMPVTIPCHCTVDVANTIGKTWSGLYSTLKLDTNVGYHDTHTANW